MPGRDAWHRSKVAQDLLQISVVGIGLQAQAALYVVQVAEPVLFMKAVTAISGPDDAIQIAPTRPRWTGRWGWAWSSAAVPRG
ncbi:hypothetical protein CTATCC11996_15850 [Comamonas testosteroni ATCC 11996]|nr:hypothetical protein CTATCC11996_15850 [Comamonas testosteroni ATCC 11996]